MTLTSLFTDDPTRELEEVQKVNAKDQAEADVREFHLTESAATVLEAVSDIIAVHPHQDRRFLYISATFGSGKTHLLKLIGMMAETDSEIAYLGDRLAQEWSGFNRLQTAIADSHVDRFVPVFLNLLSRDAAKEPPIPYLIYEAIGRTQGYPTDPNWLLEWAWMVNRDYDGLWEELKALTYEGHTFEEVLAERATLRQWLYGAVPTLDAAAGTALADKGGVKDSIETAEDTVAPAEFDADELVSRIETITQHLSSDGQQTELLIGLDELALFVGDSTPRYREFERTMEALQNGPNPVVITTGQIPLTRIRKDTIGSVSDGHWTTNQVPLEGADTETIVRKRWLDKTPTGSDEISSLLERQPDLTLETYEDLEVMDPDPVESYPFREYDLTLLRSVMQELITDGKQTDAEYIQGRALLVLVRSLFTKFEWTDKSVGALVGWDTLYELLVEETTYISLWVQEVIANNVEPNVDSRQVGVAKPLYLINKTPSVPATPENVAKLTLPELTADLEAHIAQTTADLETLKDNQCALTETTDQGDTVYTLVSEEQKTILEKARHEAKKIAPHQVSAKLKTEFLEADGFLRSDGSRHEEAVGNLRLVPLRFSYAILDTIDPTATTNYDALQIRCYAGTEEQYSQQITEWQEANASETGTEHILVGIEIPEPLIGDLKDVMGMQTVLETETEGHDQLEAKKNRKETRVETELLRLLDDATVYTPSAEQGPKSAALEEAIGDQLQTQFGDRRRVLAQSLREVDDAKAIASFFRGDGEWPLSTADAATLGVDTANRSFTTDGWAHRFIENHSGPVHGDELLAETRRENGAYRGTPRETLSALLITLATSNADVQLKLDERLETPTEIGRAVRTTSKFERLEIRFEEGVDYQRVRDVVTTIQNTEPDETDPDAIVAAFSDWVDRNSGLIKRTIKSARQFEMVKLETMESVLEAGFKGQVIAIAELDDQTLQAEADTYAAARELFRGDPSLWEQFTTIRDEMSEAYPQAVETTRLQTTAESEQVPTPKTVQTRIEDAEAHRVETLTTQFEHCFGTDPDATTPEGLCEEFETQLAAEANPITELLSWGEDTFEGVTLAAMRTLLENTGEDISEATIVDSQLQSEAKTLQRLRELYRGDPGLWAQLESAKTTLETDHPQSPTTERVSEAARTTTPPTKARIEDLLEQAKAPRPPRPDDDTWGRLKDISDALDQQLPNAALTAEITSMVNEGPEANKENEVEEKLSAAEGLLDRWATMQQELDELDSGTTVRVEK